MNVSLVHWLVPNVLKDHFARQYSIHDEMDWKNQFEAFDCYSHELDVVFDERSKSINKHFRSEIPTFLLPSNRLSHHLIHVLIHRFYFAKLPFHLEHFSRHS